MIKVNSRVKYIKVDTEADKSTGYYPPIGTLGTVEFVDYSGCRVKWDEGTQEGAWWCDLGDVEEVGDVAHLDMMIDWYALTENEQITLHSLLSKAHNACVEKEVI